MRKSLLWLLAAFIIGTASVLSAQDEPEVTDKVLFELYDGARVADVVDSLATVGYIGVGVMDPAIAPLWRDVKDMSHRF